ncbi:MAG: creatininase [Candidatus Bathyarchaeia archaeon]|jgi:creatinine amidohydrolase
MEYRADLMSWADFQRAVNQNRLVILPIGSLEQHGPHLPLGTDTITVRGLADRVAKRTRGIVVPEISYGFKPQPGSSAGNNFPGTCSLDGSTLTMLVRDVVRELVRHKVRRILILDGHYENALFINEGVDLALKDLCMPKRVKVVIARWFELIPASFFMKHFGKDFEGMMYEHASKVETSVMMALNQRSVQKNRMKNDRPIRRENYTVLPESSEFIPKSGVLSSVFPSSAKIGEELVNYAVREIVKIAGKEFPE